MGIPTTVQRENKTGGGGYIKTPKCEHTLGLARHARNGNAEEPRNVKHFWVVAVAYIARGGGCGLELRCRHYIPTCSIQRLR